MPVKKNQRKVASSFFIGLEKESFVFLIIVSLFASVSLYGVMTSFTSMQRKIGAYEASVMGTNFVVADMKSVLPESDLKVVANSGSSVVSPAVYDIFMDVKSDYKYAKAIEFLKNEGIVTGFPDGTFKPDIVISRSQAISMLIHAIDLDLSGKLDSKCFSDLTDNWFGMAVCYAKREGWIGGFSGGVFLPDAALIRSASFKLVFEAFDLKQYKPEDDVSIYTDIKIDDWFYSYVYSAYKLDLINGSKLFYPNREITRGEFSQMVFDSMGLKGLRK